MGAGVPVSLERQPTTRLKHLRLDRVFCDEESLHLSPPMSGQDKLNVYSPEVYHKVLTCYVDMLNTQLASSKDSKTATWIV